MNTTTTALPAPPNGDSRWSIVTLAVHLCLPPSVVDAEILSDDDIHSDRAFVTYTNAAGEDRGDVWLTHQSAEEIASVRPAGMLARRVAAGDFTDVRCLDPDLAWALARHIVDHYGGA